MKNNRPTPLPLPVREGSNYSQDNAQQVERHSTPLQSYPPFGGGAGGEAREGQGGGSLSFACVASDLPTFSEVVLTGDSLARNMRASMAIPALFKAVRFDDYVLYDGGIFNNLPVDVARQMGADVVIAVDLTVNHHDDDEEDDFDLSELFDITKVKGLLGWLLNRPDFKKYKQNQRAADIYINPPLQGYGVASFTSQSIAEMIAIGEREARHQFTILHRYAKPNHHL